MADGARLYQILRGRLYERLPLLALALGLLDWQRGGENRHRRTVFLRAHFVSGAGGKKAGDLRKRRFFTACCMRCCCTRGSAGE